MSGQSPPAGTRRALRDSRRSLSPEQRSVAETAINHQVIELLDAWPVGVLGGYAAIDGEVDVEPALAALRRSGRPTAYPITGDDHRMHFHLWDGVTPRTMGRHGIAEPAGPLVPRSEISALLVPMVGFTVHGDRLGFGAGYYDRYLAEHPRPLLIGVAFDLQELADVPHFAHDIAMDVVVTESREVTP